MNWYPHPTSFHRHPLTIKIHSQMGHEGVLAFIFIHEIILENVTGAVLDLDFPVSRWMSMLLFKRKSRQKLNELLLLMKNENLIDYRFSGDSLSIRGVQILDFAKQYLKLMKKNKPELVARIEDRISEYKQKPKADFNITPDTIGEKAPPKSRLVIEMERARALQAERNRPPTIADVEDMFRSLVEQSFPSQNFSVHASQRQSFEALLVKVPNLSSIQKLIAAASERRNEWPEACSTPVDFVDWFIDQKGYLNFLSDRKVKGGNT